MALPIVTRKSDLPSGRPWIELTLEIGGKKLPGETFEIGITPEKNYYVTASTRRGLLFGAGKFLRLLELGQNTISAPANLFLHSSPVYTIRGHQLGYRHAANSWDAWSVEQFDLYIRELALFGANAIENIPFQDDRTSPLMKVPRDEMNLAMSGICDKYDLDYWVWTPADFDLKDEKIRAEHLAKHEALYKACPRLDAVFFPGGDPGDNDPNLVMPFLEDVAKLLHKHHPKAGMWMSLQGFNKAQVDYFYEYINHEQPKWFAGVVSGPSSPPIDATRRRLLPQYKHRHYPDITHCVRAQYPVAWWDPAFGMTLGRECINPRPVHTAALHNFFADQTDGFLSYSDGVHDDVNKQIWTMRSWDPDMPVRDMLIEYSRFFFGADVAEDAADGILALEKNWEGAVADNGGIDATLALWERLDSQAPELRGNWRWQMCQLRAVYDAYVRHRSIYEAGLEGEAYAKILEIEEHAGWFDQRADVPSDAMDRALAILKRAESQLVKPEWRARIESLCADLFESVQLQTSVPKYTASGTERGAVLDVVDRPLNNRWWLEDEFTKVRALPTPEAQTARLREIATWENPGPGQYYDDVGNVAKSTHIVRGETTFTDPLHLRNPNPDHIWKDNGLQRDRISWLTYMDWPIAARYEHLDANTGYVIEITGQGEALTFVDGQRVQQTSGGTTPAEVKKFLVPRELSADGTIVVTWERPNEEHLNWRQRSRINEIRLVKAQPSS
ncbi:MAG: hypothetical protein SGI88_19375 [Candidatus Hydrogenedentes bacterium]|nr:hypothetical protein [Candidatus Hydrogenedentota bacterium]